jgi:hypothetical protein
MKRVVRLAVTGVFYAVGIVGCSLVVWYDTLPAVGRYAAWFVTHPVEVLAFIGAVTLLLLLSSAFDQWRHRHRFEGIAEGITLLWFTIVILSMLLTAAWFLWPWSLIPLVGVLAVALNRMARSGKA